MFDIYVKTVSLIMTAILIIVFVFFIQQIAIKREISNYVYLTCELISSKGIFTENMYNELKQSLDRFSNEEYIIKIKYEKLLKDGVYDVYYDDSFRIKTEGISSSDIINKGLNIGDRITIYVEDLSETFLERFLKSKPLGYALSSNLDLKIKSLYTAVIANKPKNIVTGYDVIADIQDKSTDNTIAVFVATKLNPSGKYYGDSSHIDVPTTNLIYGDTSDEQGVIDTGSGAGINFILGTASFKKEEIYYPSGDLRLIKYIQQ